MHLLRSPVLGPRRLIWSRECERITHSLLLLLMNASARNYRTLCLYRHRPTALRCAAPSRRRKHPAPATAWRSSSASQRTNARTYQHKPLGARSSARLPMPVAATRFGSLLNAHVPSGPQRQQQQTFRCNKWAHISQIDGAFVHRAPPLI